MNIIQQNIGTNHIIITLQVVKSDYEPLVEKALKDYRKKANVNGFRPGQAPMGMITKLYRKPLMADEINKLVSSSIDKYIDDNKLNIIGEPLPAESQKTIDFDNASDFEILFEVGLRPEITTTPDKKDKLPYFNIEVSSEMLTKTKENYARNGGKFVECDTVTGKEMIKGKLVQVDEKGKAIEGGIIVDETSIYLDVAKDEAQTKLFEGKKIGDKVKFDPKVAFPNDYELANILKVDKDKLAEISGNFEITISSVSRFENAAYTKELFDKLFGEENTISTEAEFDAKITADIEKELDLNSKYKFAIDAKEFYLKKSTVELPLVFLKRWITLTNEGKLGQEEIEKEFPAFENDLKWQLMRTSFAKANEIKVEEAEVLEYAKQTALMQFRQYGINNIPDEHLQRYTSEMLKKEGEVRKIMDRILEDKVFDKIKESVTLQEKKVNIEEFNKFFEKEEVK